MMNARQAGFWSLSSGGGQRLHSQPEGLQPVLRILPRKPGAHHRPGGYFSEERRWPPVQKPENPIITSGHGPSGNGRERAGTGRNRQKSGPPSADGLPEMPEASDLAWALTRAYEENPVRSRMERTGETARQRARPPGP